MATDKDYKYDRTYLMTWSQWQEAVETAITTDSIGYIVTTPAKASYKKAESEALNKKKSQSYNQIKKAFKKKRKIERLRGNYL